MKSVVLSIVLIINSLILSKCGSDDNGIRPKDPEVLNPIPLPVNDEFQLVFEENFDNDLSKWDIWEGGAFNEEIQLYRSEQLEVKDGILTINTKRESVTGATSPFDNTNKQFEYVSGRIESKQLFGPEDKAGERVYKIASRIKLPKGFGMWPAFWLFADPWPTLGEIDILEARGNEEAKFQSNIFYGTTNGENILKESDTKMSYEGTENLTDDFHIFALIWQEKTLEILLDEVSVIKYEASTRNAIAEIFGGDLKIVLNNAVGGVFFFNTNPEDYIDEASMQVDWVKVYKK